MVIIQLSFYYEKDKVSDLLKLMMLAGSKDSPLEHALSSLSSTLSGH